jgi:hypothetical protein
MAHGLATEGPVQADTAIRQAALDYWESWGDGNPARVEKALHPDLAKRIVRPNDSPSHPWPPGDFLFELSAMRLIQLTDHEPIPVEEREAFEVVVLDRFEDIASVKIATSGGAEYLHLAMWNGRWVVVNVLWGLLPGPPREADDAAIAAAVRGYACDDRRILHPELAKRTVGPVRVPSPEWPSPAWPPGDKLYQLSALGLGQQLQLQEEPGYAVTIYDRVANGASAKVDSLAHVNVDYLHIAKWNGEWLVVNVLWALRPEVRPA